MSYQSIVLIGGDASLGAASEVLSGVVEVFSGVLEVLSGVVEVLTKACCIWRHLHVMFNWSELGVKTRPFVVACFGCLSELNIKHSKVTPV